MPKKLDKVDQKTKVVTMRMTEALNHFLETRVLEMRAVADNKRGIDKSWLMLRLMELGQDWLASFHLGIPTDYEDWMKREIAAYEKKRKPTDEDIGYIKGLKFAFEKFEEYETMICDLQEGESL